MCIYQSRPSQHTNIGQILVKYWLWYWPFIGNLYWSDIESENRTDIGQILVWSRILAGSDIGQISVIGILYWTDLGVISVSDWSYIGTNSSYIGLILAIIWSHAGSDIGFILVQYMPYMLPRVHGFLAWYLECWPRLWKAPAACCSISCNVRSASNSKAAKCADLSSACPSCSAFLRMENWWS